MENGNVKNIITIGASAGGIAAIAKLLEGSEFHERNYFETPSKTNFTFLPYSVDGEEIVNGNVLQNRKVDYG
jgi:hypothetical protein